MSDQNEVFHVRIKPYNFQRGLKMRRHMVFGIRFDVEKGWYKVNRYILRYSEENQAEETIDLITHLRETRNDNENPESPFAFDVCTPAESKALQAAEKAAKEAAIAKAENPNPIDLVTTERKSRTSGDDAVVSVPPAKQKRKPGRPPKAKAPVATVE